MPPLHFSNFIWQRGNMHMLPIIGETEGAAGRPAAVEVGIAPADASMAERSNIIKLLMAVS
jgi:hypothetical protein